MDERNLEDYFDESGKLGWTNMVNWGREMYWRESQSQLILLEKFDYNEEVAIVMYARIGEESLE